MKEVLFDNSKGGFPSGFGIETERAEDLKYHMALIVHNLHAPTRSGESEFDDGDILAAFIKPAKTEEELSYVSFMAGRAGMEVCGIFNAEI